MIGTFEDIPMQSKVDDLSTLWDELDLKGLLASSEKHVNSYAESAQKLKLKKQEELRARKAPKRLDQIYEDSSFKVLMGRYNSAPRPPIYCTDTKLQSLADPIRGKYKNIVKIPADKKYDYIVSPARERKANSKPAGAKKTSSSFFLTTEDEIDDDSTVGNAHPMIESVKNTTNLRAKGIKPAVMLACKTKNTKANKSLFADIYLKTKKSRTSADIFPSKKKPSGNWKPSSLIDKKTSGVKSKYLKPIVKPDWSLRPPQLKPISSLQQPRAALPERSSRAAILSRLDKSLLKRDASKQSDFLLRSKSSSDASRGMRKSTSNNNNNNNNNNSSERLKKPSSTPSLPSALLGARKSIPKPATVLSPVKPLKPKELDVTHEIADNYKNLQKKLGLSSSTSSVRKQKGSPTAKHVSDEDLNISLRKAEGLVAVTTASKSQGGGGGGAPATMSLSNADLLLGQHAKKISVQLSQIDDWKLKYRKLAEEIE